MESIAEQLFAVTGDTAIASAEDLVVGLSQAVLLDQGFQRLPEAPATWAATPGLPAGHLTQRLLPPAHDMDDDGDDSDQAAADGQPIEFKWMAVGPAVMLLFAPPNGAPTATVELPVARVVAPGATFPLQAAGQEQMAETLRRGAYLTEGAWMVVAAAINARLRPAEHPAAGRRHRPRSPGAPPSLPAAEQPEYGDTGDRRQRGGRRPVGDIGSSDLDPLGRGAGGEGGGMVVGPGHPMFRRGYSPGAPLGDGGRPMGLPQGAVPPGARFDPIGPFGGVPGPARPGGRGGPAGPGGSGLFSGDPDPDAMQPPKGGWNYFM
ncbi:hypothetical protein GGI15_003577 [Coemansia interrupta]|uniref:PI31 proteasome regulator C-terminal domain-containing protein n=1 Tax=Coemansia interrupta TaxID=1126814 RepID=A0A9W8LH60_9FUNG|nr:hypothetical protein GGI15_003577 [Coemansia interrupta]